jgi:hypothetical protein
MHACIIHSPKTALTNNAAHAIYKNPFQLVESDLGGGPTQSEIQIWPVGAGESCVVCVSVGLEMLPRSATSKVAFMMLVSNKYGSGPQKSLVSLSWSGSVDVPYVRFQTAVYLH